MIEKILLLLVDDSEVDRLICTKALEDLICDIREAKNGAETLILLERETFDCVILDYLLPDYNGVELIKEIRHRDCKTPIVVTTGSVGSELEIVEIMKSGAQDYVPKDKIPTLLARAVKSAIETQKKAVEAGYYRSFYNNAPVGFFTTTLDNGTFVKANQTMLDILGYESIDEMPPASKLHVDPLVRQKFATLVKNNETCKEFEAQLNTKNGGKVWISITGKLCPGALTKCQKCLPNCPGCRCIEGSAVDITEQKELEEEIVQLKAKEIASLKEIQEAVNLRIKEFDDSYSFI